MRKLFFSMLGLFSAGILFAQPAKDSQKKPATLVMHFAMQDFVTPQRLRSGSDGTANGGKEWAKFKEQQPGLGFTFMKGISNHFDVSASYYLSMVNYPFRDGTPELGSEYLLHEMDASIQMKLLPDNFFFVPYLSGGVGASAYKDGRFDAFMPLGAGLQLSLTHGVFFFSNFQYRIPVTERANYHFLTTFGIGTSLGKND